MPSTFQDELAHAEALEDTLQRRRRVLEIQRARFGDLTPAWIILELEDIEQQLTQVQQTLRRMRSSPIGTECPYVGLFTFQEADARFFFGRDVLVGELLRKVEHATFLAVLGPSGSGKSSVVRAGLIPALTRGALPGSDQWYYLPPLKPGSRPLNTLAATLAATQAGKLGDIASIRETLNRNHDALLLLVDGLLVGGDNARLVLVVDQAEELWTLAPTDAAAHTAFIAEQQEPFIQNLLTAAAAPDQRVLIVLTMRADFLHRAIEHYKLAHWIGEHDVMVSPLLSEELRSIITRPAELVRGGFEPGLADTLVEQTISRLGALPLLEYTLLELWKARRPDGAMTWEAFKHIGGVEGGLAQRADTILSERYTTEQQAELRIILLRLVQPGEGMAVTRRRVRIDDLVSVGNSAENVYTLLKPLADERLITTGYDPVSDEGTVEISHEALIGAWPTLRNWIGETHADLRLLLQIGEAAKGWEQNGRDSSYLYRGARLTEAEQWEQTHPGILNEHEQMFLTTCLTEREREAEAREEQYRKETQLAAEQRVARRLRRLTAALLLVILITIGLTLVTLDQSSIAEEARKRAEEERSITEEAQKRAEEGRQAILNLATIALSVRPIEEVDQNSTPAVVLFADLANCAVSSGFADRLGQSLADTYPGRQILTFKRTTAVGNAAQAAAEGQGAVAVVWGACVDSNTVKVTISFTRTSRYPIWQLQEPREISLQGSMAEADRFVSAGALYAEGRIEAARATIEPLLATQNNIDTRAELYWLVGNIFLRRELWEEAKTAYDRAMTGLDINSPMRASLLANRGLTGLFAHSVGDKKDRRCETESQADLEGALLLTSDRPILHVLLGTILLQCPSNNAYIENARRQAEQALAIDSKFAPAYALLTETGIAARSMIDAQQSACTALKLDPTLPEPYRALGVIYTQYGLTDSARDALFAYARQIRLPWQARDALTLMSNLQAQVQLGTIPSSLVQCQM